MIFVDHFLAKRLGIPEEPAASRGSSFNLAVLLAAIFWFAAAPFWLKGGEQ